MERAGNNVSLVPVSRSLTPAGEKRLKPLPILEQGLVGGLSALLGVMLVVAAVGSNVMLSLGLDVVFLWWVNFWWEQREL